MMFFLKLGAGLVLAAHGAMALASAPAAPLAGPAATMLRMHYFVNETVFLADGSPLRADVIFEPKVVDGEVVLPRPWPNLVDSGRYAGADADSLFYFEAGKGGRRVVRIDVYVTGTPPRHASARVIRFGYDGADNLLEMSETSGDGTQSVARSCFAYDAGNRLVAYAGYNAPACAQGKGAD
ncbi:YD repeat-containing protein [Oxalobacteraceae bacterium GrIS 1.11]